MGIACGIECGNEEQAESENPKQQSGQTSSLGEQSDTEVATEPEQQEEEMEPAELLRRAFAAKRALRERNKATISTAEPEAAQPTPEELATLRSEVEAFDTQAEVEIER